MIGGEGHVEKSIFVSRFMCMPIRIFNSICTKNYACFCGEYFRFPVPEWVDCSVHSEKD